MVTLYVSGFYTVSYGENVPLPPAILGCAPILLADKKVKEK